MSWRRTLALSCPAQGFASTGTDAGVAEERHVFFSRSDGFLLPDQLPPTSIDTVAVEVWPDG